MVQGMITKSVVLLYWEDTFQRRLPDVANIVTAELTAILLALDCIPKTDLSFVLN